MSVSIELQKEGWADQRGHTWRNGKRREFPWKGAVFVVSGERNKHRTQSFGFFWSHIWPHSAGHSPIPRAPGGENRKSKQRAHASGSFSCCGAARQFTVQLLNSLLRTPCLLGHNALCGKKAFQSPNWGKANANALFQNAAESMLLRG